MTKKWTRQNFSKLIPLPSPQRTIQYRHFHVFIIPTMAGTRRSYCLKEKRHAVHSINFMIERGDSKTMSCRSVGIPILYYQLWSKTLQESYLECFHVACVVCWWCGHDVWRAWRENVITREPEGNTRSCTCGCVEDDEGYTFLMLLTLKSMCRVWKWRIWCQLERVVLVMW